MTGTTGRSSYRLEEFELAWLSLPVGVAIALAVFLYAPIPADMAKMLAITAFCVSLWVGTPVDPWFTGLVGLGLIGVSFTSELALVGFRSPATWLVVLGILLGEATQQSGLPTLIERLAFDVLPSEAGSDATVAYRHLLVVLSTVALGFVVLVRPRSFAYSSSVLSSSPSATYSPNGAHESDFFLGRFSSHTTPVLVS